MNRVRSTALLACLLGCQPLIAADGQIDVLVKDSGTVELTVAGSYVLVSTPPVRADALTAIRIKASDVTLDMNGQTLRGGTAAGVVGITIDPGVSRAQIKNGTVTGFKGGGILVQGDKHVISNMQIIDSGQVGIDVSAEFSTVSDSEVHGCATNLRVAGAGNRILRNNLLSTPGGGTSLFLNLAIAVIGTTPNYVEHNVLGDNGKTSGFSLDGTYAASKGQAVLYDNVHSRRITAGPPACGADNAYSWIGISGRFADAANPGGPRRGNTCDAMLD